MNLGLENFWAKGNCFAKYDVELAECWAGETKTKLHPQTSHQHLHGVERQPEGVQVEGVGLVSVL